MAFVVHRHDLAANVVPREQPLAVAVVLAVPSSQLLEREVAVLSRSWVLLPVGDFVENFATVAADAVCVFVD
jgi:hypothetical protein